MTLDRNHGPLRAITRREHLASRVRISLACGHAHERSYVTPMALYARCPDCLPLGSTSPGILARSCQGEPAPPNATPPIEAPDPSQPALLSPAPAGLVGPAGVTPFDCPACMGEGTIPVNPAYPDPQGAFDAPCVDCGGTGRRTARPDAPDLAA